MLMKLTLLQIGSANLKCIHMPPAFQPGFPASPPFWVTSAINSASPGLQSKSQRLGVIPLVLFWNLSGSSSLKSLNLEIEETHHWIWLKWQVPTWSKLSYIQEAKCRFRNIKERWKEGLTAATAVLLNRNSFAIQSSYKKNSKSNHLHMISWHWHIYQTFQQNSLFLFVCLFLLLSLELRWFREKGFFFFKRRVLCTEENTFKYFDGALPHLQSNPVYTSTIPYWSNTRPTTTKRKAHTWVFTMSEWILATPFTAWEPTMQRWAMLILLPPSSSTRDILLRRSTSLGNKATIF